MLGALIPRASHVVGLLLPLRLRPHLRLRGPLSLADRVAGCARVLGLHNPARSQPGSAPYRSSDDRAAPCTRRTAGRELLLEHARDYAEKLTFAARSARIQHTWYFLLMKTARLLGWQDTSGYGWGDGLRTLLRTAAGSTSRTSRPENSPRSTKLAHPARTVTPCS